MQKRNMDFVSKSLPIIEQLTRQWFPPGLKSEEGYSYGCMYCDMQCDGSGHDRDCILDLAKQVFEKIQEIQSDPRYLKDQQGNNRPLEDVQEMRYYWIKNHLLGEFYTPLMQDLIPLDYQDPSNKSIVCLCMHSGYGGRIKQQHSPSCVYQRLANILSDLYKP